MREYTTKLENVTQIEELHVCVRPSDLGASSRVGRPLDTPPEMTTLAAWQTSRSPWKTRPN
ncbi:MAG: hypothetical protein JRE45_15660 [Deltaproteobacteria bacterium]|nr:hypothetical protein [Deltaproteobacteria bacterium]